jgi:cell division protein FtsW
MSLFSRTDKSLLGQWWWTVDRPILAACLTLAVIGVIMVATASPPVAEHLDIGSYYFLKRHIILLIPALGVMVGVSLLTPRQIWRLASVCFVGATIAMILVLLIGMEIKGARRWLHVAGFSLQPSEFIKPAFAIAAAWFMAQHKKNDHMGGTLIAVALFGLSATLLMMQPDFGMTFVLTLIFCIQIFLAGLPLRYVVILGGCLMVGMLFVYFTFGHVQSRVDRFFNPQSGDNYQVEQSLEAFRQGGLVGKGPGQGTVKLNLPDAHADFIFSVAGEEMGLVVILVIMGLYAFILLRGFSKLMEQDDMFNVLAAGGLLTMVGVQAFIHMGSAFNILPAKGMTLPLISYGGSSVLAMGLTLGALLALTRKKKR